MDIERIIILLSVALLAAIVGYLVLRRLEAERERREAEANDEILARAAGLAGGNALDLLTGMLRRQRAQQVRVELPDALDMVANSLTAGLTLPQALLRNLDHFSPAVQTEFARVIYDTRLGFSISEAFGNFADRLGLNDAKMVSIASRIGVEHGGNLADSYRMLSTLLRDSLAFEMELKAMTTEGRMQALVMSCLPFVLLLILSVISWDLVGPLFTTVVGWGVLAGLCVMLVIAYVWIRKIVDIKV